MKGFSHRYCFACKMARPISELNNRIVWDLHIHSPDYIEVEVCDKCLKEKWCNDSPEFA
jgi:hypothetical protein